MDGAQTATVALASATAALVIGALWLLVVTRREVRAMQHRLDDVRVHTATMLAELRQAILDAAPAESDVEPPTSTSTIAPASRVAYGAFGDPVIKALALRAGTSRAVKRLRNGNGNGNGNGG